MAGFDQYYRPSGITYRADGTQVQGVNPSPMTISQMQTNQQNLEATRSGFQSAHPGATSMTTGQLYGVGAPNNNAPSYDSIKQNYYNVPGNGSDAQAAAGWDAWAKAKQAAYGVGTGGTLGGTAGGAGGPGNGYTGYGGSNLGGGVGPAGTNGNSQLTATGTPQYTGGVGPAGTNGSSGPIPNMQNYYAGMPQSNTPPPVMPYLNQNVNLNPYNPSTGGFSPAPMTYRR